MFRRNLGLFRTVNGGRKYLSTKQQQQQNKECLSDQDGYPAESGFVRNSPYDNISIPNLTLDQYVWNTFRDWETKIATVSDWSFEDLEFIVNTLIVGAGKSQLQARLLSPTFSYFWPLIRIRMTNLTVQNPKLAFILRGWKIRSLDGSWSSNSNLFYCEEEDWLLLVWASFIPTGENYIMPRGCDKRVVIQCWVVGDWRLERLCGTGHPNKPVSHLLRFRYVWSW